MKFVIELDISKVDALMAALEAADLLGDTFKGLPHALRTREWLAKYLGEEWETDIDYYEDPMWGTSLGWTPVARKGAYRISQDSRGKWGCHVEIGGSHYASTGLLDPLTAYSNCKELVMELLG